MKRSLFMLAIIASTTNSFAQWTKELSIGYAFSSPTGKMKQNINHGHGVVADFHFITPGKKVALGIDLNYTPYGFSKTRQIYTFGDGTTADMDVTVSNSFVNLMASSRYYLINKEKINVFVGLKAGYSYFSTDLNIYDPDDKDTCKPLENDLLQEDGTFLYSVGGGLQYDLSSLFKKLKKEALYINLSAFYTQGGTVKYMNQDTPDGHAMSSPPNRVSDLEASFINTQTLLVHTHHVGYVYSSYAQMMDFRFTFTFRIQHK